MRYAAWTVPRSSDSSGGRDEARRLLRRLLRLLRPLAAVCLLGGLAPGCYLSHGEDPERVPAGREPAGREPAGRDGRPDAFFGVDDPSRPDGAPPDEPDGSTPIGDADVPPDFDVCQAMCDAQEAAGCFPPGCYAGCQGRLEQAAEVHCEAELKGTLSCMISMPCNRDRMANCGVMNGWPQCLGLGP